MKNISSNIFQPCHEMILQVLLCSEEAELVLTKFLTSLNKEWDLTEDFEVCSSLNCSHF